MWILLALLVITVVKGQDLQIKKILPTFQQSQQPEENTVIDCHMGDVKRIKLDHYKHIQISGCSLFEGNITINELCKQNFKQFLYGRKILYNNGQKLIYVLNQKSLLWYKYINNPVSLQYKYSHQFSYSLQCNNKINLMHFHPSQQYIYIFLCDSIQILQVKFTRPVILHQFKSPFYATNLYATQDIFILSSYDTFRVYGIQTNHNLTLITEISINVEHQTIQSIVYHKGILYVLLGHSIYTYKRQNDKFVYKNNISDSISSPENDFLSGSQMTLWKNTIFIHHKSGISQYISQLQIIQEELVLVRYYKGFKYIKNMMVIQGKLLVISQKGLSYYQINLDPRIIDSQNNAISNFHVEYIENIIHLQNNYYIVLAQHYIAILDIFFNPYAIECKIKEHQQHQFKINRTCKNQQFSNKDANSQVQHKFYEHCVKKQLIKFNIIKQILGMVLIFIIIILLLIYWRKNKLVAIKNLLNNLNSLRKKKKNTVEFMQTENYPQKQFQDEKEQQEEQVQKQTEVQFKTIQ